MKYGILIIAHPHTCCRTCSSQLASVCEAKNNRILWQRGPFCDSSVKSSAFMHRYPKLTEEFHRKMRLSLAKCQPGNNTRAVSNVWAHRRIKREDWFFFPPQVDLVQQILTDKFQCVDSWDIVSWRDTSEQKSYFLLLHGCIALHVLCWWILFCLCGQSKILWVTELNNYTYYY